MNYEEAHQIMVDNLKNPNMHKHCYAVEAAMRAYAKHFGEDEETWAVAGILHDFDYEKWPEEHPAKGEPLLKEMNVPAEIIQAIQEHGYIPAESRMGKALKAVDRLTGLITAVALVRPDKKLETVKIKSVKKKMKDKGFAAQIDREDLRACAQDLGVEFEEHVQIVLDAMKSISDKLGL
ncbi:HDIG domain-containing protein [Candidatus Peregrinibacteria bacterium]|jgi:putative nucleotidyltransferase with HDIG domain|nr:HDIG domain-containing protein [Candidatus Peregrinibacteria bacterium]MBT7703399.1 HDIG domain-containing protein [Candidatus Peregrinibacteria bacterium]